MKKTIADSVSDKIEKGEVAMRSKRSIWGEKLRLDGSVVILLTFLTLFAGFLFYWINSNNDLLFGGYGQYGLSSFFQSFPYIFVIGFIALFIFLILIFRTFDFSYKKPFFLILLFVASGVLAMGWISSKQPMGQQIYKQNGRYLRMGMMNNRNAASGIVTEVRSNSLTIQDEKKIKSIITFNSNTHFPFEKPKVGDSIRAIGTRDGLIFNAFGIRVFDESNPSVLGPETMQRRGQRRGMMWNW